MKKLIILNIIFLLICLKPTYGQRKIMSDFLSVKVNYPENNKPQILSNFVPKDSPCIIFAFSPVGCTGTIVSLLSAINNFEIKNNLMIKKIFLIYHSNPQELQEYTKFIHNHWKKEGISVLSTTDMSILVQYKINSFTGATVFYFKPKEVNELFDTMQLYVNPELVTSTLEQLKK